MSGRRSGFAVLVLGLLMFLLPAAADGSTRALSWGGNSQGVLGIGTEIPSRAPAAIREYSGMHSISSSTNDGHTMALRPNGEVLVWGSNSSGQSGSDPSSGPESRPTPALMPVNAVSVTAAGSASYAVKADGTVVKWGDFKLKPAAVPGLSGIKQIAAGALHVLALRKDGTVLAWGSNQDSQFGNGTTDSSGTPVPVPGLTGVEAIAAGGSQSLALMGDGSVRRWGLLNAGPDFPVTRILEPEAVPGITGATEISAGSGSALALLGDGTIRSWGFNYQGQLGNGTTTGSLDPVSVEGIDDAVSVSAGSSHALALLADGSVRAWGWNLYGQLGNGTILGSNVPITTVGLNGVKEVVAGAVSSYAVQDSNQPMATVSYGATRQSETFGYVEGSGVGVPGPRNSMSYPVGVILTFTAANDRVSSFTNWSGLCTSTDPWCVVKLKQDSVLNWNFRVDDPFRIAPDTRLSRPIIKRRAGFARFLFMDRGPGRYVRGSYFQCRLLRKAPASRRSSRPFRPCAGKGFGHLKIYKRLGTGRYLFAVRAANRFGVDRTPEKFSFRINRPKR